MKEETEYENEKEGNKWEPEFLRAKFFGTASCYLNQQRPPRDEQENDREKKCDDKWCKVEEDATVSELSGFVHTSLCLL